MERAVVLLLGDAAERVGDVSQFLEDAGISVKQRFDDVRVPPADVDRFLELADLSRGTEDEAAPADEKKPAKGGKKGAAAAKKGGKGSADESAAPASAEEQAEALRGLMQRYVADTPPKASATRVWCAIRRG